MYAIVDVETTGLSPRRDRIVEIGVVALTETGALEWSWSTLVRPGRDVGPTHIHGLRASDVAAAPSFADIAGYLVFLLTDRVIVGHNIAFDWRMLQAEFERIGVATPDPVATVCTCTIARSVGHYPATLDACLGAYGLANAHAHSAESDALATAELFTAMVDLTSRQALRTARAGRRQMGAWPFVPVIDATGVKRQTREVDVDAAGAVTIAALDGVVPSVESMPMSVVDDAAAAYLAVLETVMEDRILDPDEVLLLTEVATELQLTPEQVGQAHRTYLRSFAATMWLDGIITADEHRDLCEAAELLGLPRSAAIEALGDPHIRAPAPDNQLNVGDRVVFTGTTDRARTELVADATAAGLKVTTGVSRLTKFLVASDAASESGKAAQARKLGVRIISEHVFARRLMDLTGRVPAAQDRAGGPTLLQ